MVVHADRGADLVNALRGIHPGVPACDLVTGEIYTFGGWTPQRPPPDPLAPMAGAWL
jgi:hypothetical protein